MLKNFLKIAWRNIYRHKIYSLINLFGLATGLCSCIVIYVITSHELSYDSFHPDKSRIYRVLSNVTDNTGETLQFSRVPYSAAVEGRSSITGLESIAAIVPYNTPISIPGTGNKPAGHFDSQIEGLRLSTTAIAGTPYFNIFKYEWLAGQSSALENPFTVVLTESRAKLYFGKNPISTFIGRQIIYDDSLTLTVAGIIKDWNQNTDLPFTDFISSATLKGSFLANRINTTKWDRRGMSAWIFTKLKRNVNPQQANAQLAEMVKKHPVPGMELGLVLEPLSNMHFNENIIENPIRTAHKPTIYALVVIALFMLSLAVINYINLSTAQSLQRAKEMGVRKVMGSSKTGLAVQFLTETFLLTLLAVVVAVAMVNPVLAVFSSFIPEGVTFHLGNATTILFIAGVTLVTSLLAGIYPSKVLASIRPALSLKGIVLPGTNSRWPLRKALIVFQFTVSLVFIMGSIVISDQLQYVREKDHGFNADAIITVDGPRGENPRKISVLAQQIAQIAGVNKVALQWLPPMSENPREMKLKVKSTDDKEFWVTQVAGNENFIPLYQVKLIAGRNLVKSDSVNEFVINESLSRFIGDKTPVESLGKILYWNDQPYPVVGVVADFHSHSLHDPITPACIINRQDREGSIAIKLSAAGRQQTALKVSLAKIEAAWKRVYPAAAFNFRFFDESLDQLYKKDQQTATLMGTATGITIFISCIGLFGLSLFTAQKRAKEISIRKVLGAGMGNIIALLSKDFIVLIIIALFIASPLAWYFMHQWLEGFAYRISISWWIFLLAGMAAISIALITISFQACKAAFVNPVKGIRTE